VTPTRLPQSHGAPANHFAGELVDEEDFRGALELIEKGVYLGDLPLDIWKSLRRLSPGALAAMLAGG